MAFPKDFLRDSEVGFLFCRLGLCVREWIVWDYVHSAILSGARTILYYLFRSFANGLRLTIGSRVVLDSSSILLGEDLLSLWC